MIPVPETASSGMAWRGYVPGRGPGMLVRRDRWNPSSREVTEALSRSWAWAIGWWDLLVFTSRWRAQ